jgi:hypothetical protein
MGNKWFGITGRHFWVDHSVYGTLWLLEAPRRHRPRPNLLVVKDNYYLIGRTVKCNEQQTKVDHLFVGVAPKQGA